MSGLILCQSKVAETPFYIENVNLNIFSIEELCFYLANNLYLIDETILNEDLIRWIREELGMETLSVKLRNAAVRNNGIEDYLFPIFREIHYFSYEELKAFQKSLAKYHRDPAPVRAKCKADLLVKNGMYVRAILAYEAILSSGSREMHDGFEGMVWYNMGCTCMYLFLREKAVECFENAYRLLRTGASLRSLLLAYAEYCPKEEYERKVQQLRVDPATLQEIERERADFRDGSSSVSSQEPTELLLGRLTAEYHRNTGL